MYRTFDWLDVYVVDDGSTRRFRQVGQTGPGGEDPSSGTAGPGARDGGGPQGGWARAEGPPQRKMPHWPTAAVLVGLLAVWAGFWAGVVYAVTRVA